MFEKKEILYLIFYPFPIPGHKKAFNLAALHLTIFFKLHCVPHVILHQIVYFYCIIFIMMQIFSKNIGTSPLQGRIARFLYSKVKAFIHTYVLYYYFILKNCVKCVYRLGSSHCSL